MKCGIVVIGRNEGAHLRRALTSALPHGGVVVYVDSGSTDNSMEIAAECGAEAVELGRSSPFTAARARNAGYRHLLAISPTVEFIQFMDGDCELCHGWLQTAVRLLQAEQSIGAVCGRRRERHPEHSIYNWLCDQEWNREPGDTRYFGGDVLIRTTALLQANGYRDNLIAGEDPELALRLRRAGWRLRRLEVDMTLHDARITRFRQWLRRTYRGGYAYAEGARLHGSGPERHFIWEARRAWIWGIWIPLICISAAGFLWPWGLLTWLLYPLQVLRLTRRTKGTAEDRFRVALFQTVAKFPEGLGQLMSAADHMRGRSAQLIEYRKKCK